MNTSYPGLIIPGSCVRDADSKASAVKYLYDWKPEELPLTRWFDLLSKGRIIAIGKFEPKADGTYTHAKEQWVETNVIFADGDNFKAVEADKDGNDINPTGEAAWTGEKELGARYPNLLTSVYAVGESVNSMVAWRDPGTPPYRLPHRRFRLCFVFDKPITTLAHYEYIFERLARECPIITPAKRQPGQPVFGNACADTNEWYENKVTLQTDQYLAGFGAEPPTTPSEKGVTRENDFKKDTKGKGADLHEWLQQHNIDFRYSNDDPRKFFVTCPNKAQHSEGKHGATDAYVFEDGNGWGFYCSHAHCEDKRTWDYFKTSHGIHRSTLKHPQLLKHDVISDDADILTTGKTDSPLVFPEELFTGVFGAYRDSFKGRIPVPDSFAFATLKHVISASLGRRVFLSEVLPIYPNFFTGLIGESSIGHKGVSITLATNLLRQGDPNVFVLTRTTTEEGLIDLMVEPTANTGDDDVTTYSGGIAPLVKEERMHDMLYAKDAKESLRIMGAFEELSALLTRSKKTTASGVPELLMNLYDQPREIAVANKQSKCVAEFPTFSLIGGSEFGLIEKAMNMHLITGGFTNRFEWYIGEEKEPLFLYERPEPERWDGCVKILQSLRQNYPEPTGFEMTADAYALGQKWTLEHNASLNNIDNVLVASSLKRQKMHLIKNALLFAALTKRGDHKVQAEDIEQAITLAKYTVAAVEHLFNTFARSEHQRVVNRIKEVLGKIPLQSAKQIHNRMTWADLREVHLALDLMAQMQIVGIQKPKRTNLYFLAKEEAD